MYNALEDYGRHIYVKQLEVFVSYVAAVMQTVKRWLDVIQIYTWRLPERKDI